MSTLDARDIYHGSDGAATTAYYNELSKRGPIGLVAVNLFRASKCSARAKGGPAARPGEFSHR